MSTRFERMDGAVPTRFELATSALTGRRALQTAPRDLGIALTSTPNGIRTRVTCVKGRRPRPLDDGGSCLMGQHNIPEGAAHSIRERFLRDSWQFIR